MKILSICKNCNRWAKDVSTARAEEEGHEKQFWPAWISEALHLVRFHRPGFWLTFLATSKGTVVLWTPFSPQETAYSPSSFSKLKSCIPACLKTKSPSRGIEISGLAIIRVTGIPLVIAAADIATDSNLLFDMSYLWNDLFFDNYGDSGDNVT